MIDRRFLLKSSGLALIAGGFLPKVFVRMAEAGTPASKRVLVAIFQRGAVDGLNVVVPLRGEDLLRRAAFDRRPAAGLRRGRGPGSGRILRTPSSRSPPILPLFKDRSAAFVHAAGSPDATRSHFDAQDFMESGTPGVKATADGFLCRALAGKPAERPSPLRAVSLTPALPRILAGRAGAVAMSNIAQFGIRAGGATPAVSESFESMYAEAVAGALGDTAKESFDAVRILKSSDPAKIAPENGAEYPEQLRSETR